MMGRVRSRGVGVVDEALMGEAERRRRRTSAEDEDEASDAQV